MVRRHILHGLLLLTAAACAGPAPPPEARPLWVWDAGRVLDLAPPGAGLARFQAADPEVLPGAGALVGPVLLLDVRRGSPPDRPVPVDRRDLDQWVAANGAVPDGAVLLLRTGARPGEEPALDRALLDLLCARHHLRGVGTDLAELPAEARAALRDGSAWWITGLTFPAGPLSGRARLVAAPHPEQRPDASTGWPVRAFLLLPRGTGRR